MKLQDLDIGMLVVTRMGSVYVVMPNTSSYEGKYMFTNNDGFLVSGNYDENFNDNSSLSYDIVKVYNITNKLGVGLFRSIEYRELLFKRKEVQLND